MAMTPFRHAPEMPTVCIDCGVATQDRCPRCDVLLCDICRPHRGKRCQLCEEEYVPYKWPPYLLWFVTLIVTVTVVLGVGLLLSFLQVPYSNKQLFRPSMVPVWIAVAAITPAYLGLRRGWRRRVFLRERDRRTTTDVRPDVHLTVRPGTPILVVAAGVASAGIALIVTRANFFIAIAAFGGVYGAYCLYRCWPGQTRRLCFRGDRVSIKNGFGRTLMACAADDADVSYGYAAEPGGYRPNYRLVLVIQSPDLKPITIRYGASYLHRSALDELRKHKPLRPRFNVDEARWEILVRGLYLTPPDAEPRR
jgi:hypothetical protein